MNLFSLDPFFDNTISNIHISQDQVIMCVLYVVCKVSLNKNAFSLTLFLPCTHLQVSGKAFEKNFTDIMKHYRNQPQATSHVYRSVLLAGKAAATSPQVELSPCPLMLQ